MVYTALQLSKMILEETKVPMNPEEIWAHAVKKGYDKMSNIHGKTPWDTLGAQIYTNIQNNPDSIFKKVSVRPQKFGLTSIDYGTVSSQIKEKSPKNKEDDRAIERDLHPLLVSYVNSNNHFLGHTKTIYHESSSKGGKNAEKWMHPDLVAVNFPFDDLTSSSIDLANNVGMDTISIFSFELKRAVNNSNVREYYFQAVSNSSWANEGYLVALSFTEESMRQLRRLNASFGIGVIKLNLDDVYQSEILLPSRENDLDIGAIDDLSRINPDFDKFIKGINDCMRLKHFVQGSYDKVFDGDDLEEYIIKKKLRELK